MLFFNGVLGKKKKVALWCIQICRHIRVKSTVSQKGWDDVRPWYTRTAAIKGADPTRFPFRAVELIKDEILTMKTGVVDINTGSNSSPWWIYEYLKAISYECVSGGCKQWESWLMCLTESSVRWTNSSGGHQEHVRRMFTHREPLHHRTKWYYIHCFG